MPNHMRSSQKRVPDKLLVLEILMVPISNPFYPLKTKSQSLNSISNKNLLQGTNFRPTSPSNALPQILAFLLSLQKMTNLSLAVLQWTPTFCLKPLSLKLKQWHCLHLKQQVNLTLPRPQPPAPQHPLTSFCAKAACLSLATLT